MMNERSITISMKVIRLIVFWYAFVSIFGGLLFIGAGLFSWWYDNRLPRVCTVETAGVVTNVELEYHDWDDGSFSTSYYPVVEYTTAGSTIEQRYCVGESTCRYVVGQQVTVMYNPEQYSEYFIVGDENIGNNTSAILFVVAGAIFILCGFVPSLFQRFGIRVLRH